MKQQSSLNFEMRIVESLTRKVRKEIIDAERELEEEQKQEATKSGSKTRREARQLLQEVTGTRLFEATIPDDSAAERLVELRDSLADYKREDSLGTKLRSSAHVFLPDDADVNASSIDWAEANEVQVIEFFNEDWTEEDVIVEDNMVCKESDQEEEQDANADGHELLLERLLNCVDPISEGATTQNENVDITGDLMGDSNNENNNEDGEEDGDGGQSHGNTIVTESVAGASFLSLKQKRVGASQGTGRGKKQAIRKQTSLFAATKKPPPPPPPKSPKTVAKMPKMPTPNKNTPARNNPQTRQTPPRKAKERNSDKKKSAKKQGQHMNALKEREESSDEDNDEEEEDFKETESESTTKSICN